MRTITLCSGKGGVGKTLLATTLGRIIQRDEDCKVLLVDLDLSVRGLTLLAFQNKYQLDQLPLSLIGRTTGHRINQPAGPPVKLAASPHINASTDSLSYRPQPRASGRTGRSSTT